MTTDLPPALTAAVERIESPQGSTVVLPSEVTGELRSLLAWWQAVSGSGEPRAVIVEAESPDGQSAAAAMEAGVTAADRAVDEGATVLVPRVLVRHDLAARTIIAVLTRSDAAALVPQPPGLRDGDWMAQVTSVRDGNYRVAEHRGDPVDLLNAVDAASIAFIVGVLVGSAARQTPCLIDGTDELAAALVADRISLTAKQWWRCGSDSHDPARTAAIDRADLDRGLPLRLTDDDGLGAESTLALLRLLTA